MEDLRGLYSHIAGTVHRMAPFSSVSRRESIIGTTGITAPVTAAFIKAGLNNLRRDERTNAIVHSDQTQTAILLPFRRLSAKSQSNPFLTEKKRVSPLHDRMRDLAADFLAKHIPIRLMILRKHKDYTCGSIPTMKSL